MSGWTYITVEPKNKATETTLDDSDIDRLEDEIELMRAGDATEQADALLRLNNLTEELASKAGHVDAGERVDDYLDSVVENHVSAEATYTDHTLLWGPRGLAHDKSDAQDRAEEIFDACDNAKRVLIISANDTSDSGVGVLFGRDGDGGAREIDYKEGYEGAVGADVRGYFKDKHDIRGKARR